MDFIDHGDWIHYTPDPWPAHLSAHRNIMFAKRVSDGRDWYDFQRSELTGLDTIKMTLLPMREHLIVQATYHDASYIFPAAHKLIEIASSEDHESFRQKRFDLQRREFLPPLPQSVMRLDLVRAMNRAGLLDAWDRAVDGGERMLKLSMLAERPMDIDDRDVRAVAKILGWSEAQLMNLFEDANKQVRSQNG
jgi:hypothetical protein